MPYCGFILGTADFQADDSCATTALGFILELFHRFLLPLLSNPYYLDVGVDLNYYSNCIFSLPSVLLYREEILTILNWVLHLRYKVFNSQEFSFAFCNILSMRFLFWCGKVFFLFPLRMLIMGVFSLLFTFFLVGGQSLCSSKFVLFLLCFGQYPSFERLSLGIRNPLDVWS